ncbi:hypothetical protein AVEN_181002-1 [Araneus ventricosus]|uniref:Uncharacterized protein n=1 Tax=Araneus ventricosus TaxID=182803 RepID=A0A4Y2MG70_ARAVE|nr:hypothetical protein AVEN_181002-1 [Araneus ventricosus]
MQSLQQSYWWKGNLTRLQKFVVFVVFVTVFLQLSGYRTTQHGKFVEIVAAVGFLVLFYRFCIKMYNEKPLKSNKELLISKATSYNHVKSRSNVYDPSDTGITHEFGLTDLVEGEI